METTEQLRDLAKARTRDMLATSSAFGALGVEEQRDLYKDMYRRNLADLSAAQSVPATAPGNGGQAEAFRLPFRGPRKASDLIDDQRHLNQRIDQAGELAGDFIENVDFPQFVEDLLEAVFDSNLKVTLSQQESFLNLLKTATGSLAKFVNEIDDTAAFGYLADNNSDEFNIDFPDEDNNSPDPPKPLLMDASGNQVDTEDTRIKTKIMEAKIQMAREQRALLRETLLLGINRLIIEKGNVRASVLFDIKASEQIQKADKAAMQRSVSKSRSISAGGGLIGKIFGGGSAGGTKSLRKTRISVSSAKSTAQTQLQAKLAGSVDITFKSDVFPLERFADLFQQSGGAPGAPGAPGGAPVPGGGAPAPAR